MQNLTHEKVEELRKQLAEKTAELEALESKEPSEIWLNDLESIELALDERDRAIKQAEEDELKAQKKTATRQATKSKKRAPTQKRVAKKKKNEDSEDVNFVPEKKVLKKKATVSRPRKLALKQVMTSDDDDDDEELEQTLFERLQLSKTISNDSSESSLTGSKRPSPKASSKAVTSTKRAKASKKPPAKKSANKTKGHNDKFDDEEDFVCNSESENDMEVDNVAPASRSGRTTRAFRAKSKPVCYVVDDDDSFMVDSDNDSDF